MSNPVEAFAGTICDGCDATLMKGDSLYLNDGERLCELCAGSSDMICDCGEYKKPKYDFCYSCHESDKEERA